MNAISSTNKNKIWYTVYYNTTTIFKITNKGLILFKIVFAFVN